MLRWSGAIIKTQLGWSIYDNSYIFIRHIKYVKSSQNEKIRLDGLCRHFFCYCNGTALERGRSFHLLLLSNSHPFYKLIQHNGPCGMERMARWDILQECQDDNTGIHWLSDKPCHANKLTNIQNAKTKAVLYRQSPWWDINPQKIKPRILNHNKGSNPINLKWV